MRVTEALGIIQGSNPASIPFPIVLAVGFTPLHLKTFLHAHLQQALPDRSVAVSEGLYGDLCGTLGRAAATSPQGVAVALEWPDLDSRLGYRSTARWSEAGTGDILNVAEQALERIRGEIEAIAEGVRITLSLPGLPLPPMFQTPGWQAASVEVRLDRLLASFCASIDGRPGLSMVNQWRLSEESPPAARFDLRSELLFGFPYSLAHADALGASHARLMAPPAPRKGIITDLDDTLWNGIAGEVGPDGISWDLSAKHHLHALYQNLLSSLSERGVLVGVASKNDPVVIEKCFQRTDILLQSRSIFPFEVHWQAKSGSVGRILKKWNVSADSVIFVDDSPLELAEVAAAHPGIQCIQFPRNDHAAGMRMLTQIRDLCGKDAISPEDVLRLDSIRRGAEFQREANESSAPESFLEAATATITFDFRPGERDPRILELVNKTNQFNLNGVRLTEQDWLGRTAHPGSVLAVVSYEDKFGPLGKISVILGTREDGALQVSTWVMSCRAFSRRVEHQCIRTLFDRLQVEKIVFDFRPTDKNGPLQEFFRSLIPDKPEGPITLTRDKFQTSCPKLFHQVRQYTEKDNDG